MGQRKKKNKRRKDVAQKKERKKRKTCDLREAQIGQNGKETKEKMKREKKRCGLRNQQVEFGLRGKEQKNPTKEKKKEKKRNTNKPPNTIYPSSSSPILSKNPKRKSPLTFLSSCQTHPPPIVTAV